tara:strand:+ start:8 stop:1255 length:1248 start_codon:yes stop_codon:yes gene_type:complete
MRQLAIVTPYAQFRFRFMSSAATTSTAKDIDIVFRRRTDIMPALPSVTKHHPTAAKENMLLIKDLLAQTREKTLLNFLHKEFTCISKDLSARLIQELGYGFETDMHPSEVTDKQATRIQQLLADARFDDPNGSCLSPAGEYNLRLGIMKELGPEWIASFCAPALACGGHPLIVEACVSLGGREVKPGFNVFRFANRIPLLFEGGNDVVTRCVQRLNWNSYKIDKNNDKIGVFVSIVSTKIPFKGTSKEYIGDENSEIAEAVDKAIKQCALQLRGKIVRAQVAKDRKARKKQLTRYIPDVARAVFAMLAASADSDLPPSKRARLAGALWNVNEAWESKVLEQAREGQVSEDIIKSKLEEHVQRSDHEQALEFAMQNSKNGLSELMYIAPRTPEHEYLPEIRSETCAFRMLKSAELR